MKKLIFTAFGLALTLSACVPGGSVDVNTGNNTNSSAQQEASQPSNPEPTINDQTMTEDNNFSKAILKTNLGNITVEFYGQDSPKTVANFIELAQSGFYDNTKFHRVIKDFMIQGGDPLSKDDSSKTIWGTGGPGYKFADEFNSHKLVRGSLAMANSGPNTNGSQFFIVTVEATPWLDGRHTNFGQVIDGMEVVDKIEAAKTDEADRPLQPVIINSIELVK